ncbi:MAG TPA: hypothetical protein DCM86_05200 [Verrucomicrobiales bacterium]|nr:hypothetical protein [Verrucomicrobiales bacterium]
MPDSQTNPALTAFLASIREGLAFGQIWILPASGGYEIRHIADRQAPLDTLRRVNPDGLRRLAQEAPGGAFRPLRTAPDLASGWWAGVAGGAGLESAVDQIYPGAIADWYAASLNPVPVTHYREYTSRQSGMYRITAKLSDAQAAAVGRACCDARFCIRRRLWTLPGLEADAPEGKSLIPCLEPCPLLMEFARKAMRIDQEEAPPVPVALRSEDLLSIRSALERVRDAAGPGRVADFADPLNPRRLALVLDKLPGVQSASAEE